MPECMMKSAAKSDLVGKIARALERAGLGRAKVSTDSAGELILVALSGGPDSVALLHALRELEPGFGYRLAAAHLNHRLRGAESDRDEAFVRQLCSTLRVELLVEQANNLDPALDAAAPNLEERAREARYAFLLHAAKRLGSSRIATAHHADDQAETVMLRLLRGAGAAGLGAMAESGTLAPHAVTILRPMLQAWRHEILSYLDSIGARFVSDSSNGRINFLRNRIRIELLPRLERDFGPGLRRRLAALAGEMRELDDFVGLAARTELGHRIHKGTLDIVGFAGLHPALATALLREFVASRIGGLRRLTRRHIDGLRRLCLGESPSAALDLPGGWRAERRYAALALDRRSELNRHPESNGPAERAAGGFAVALAREGITKVPQARFVFHSSLMSADAAPMPAGLYEACLDADRAAAGLVVRNFAPGDRIAPLGMGGTRKLQDIFVDRKLGRARRPTFPVVTLEGQVAWLPGMARGQVALISSQTIRVLRLRALEK
jgi:tRNA(Ile)-lysidine synthase